MAALAAAALVVQGTARPADGLRAGMQLVYASNGAEQPPWTIDSVALDVAYPPRSACARFLIRRRPDQPQADETRLCVARDTLYGWSARRSAWVVQRPVGPNMTWTSVNASGDTVRYATTTVAQEQVSGQAIAVVLTTVLTVDSLGKPKRRLRERYALAFATAIGGRFELPDAAAPDGWRTEQEFELRSIRIGR